MARARASEFSAGALNEKDKVAKKGVGLAAPDEGKQEPRGSLIHRSARLSPNTLLIEGAAIRKNTPFPAE